MLKKVFWASALLVGGALVLFGTDAGSYVRTAMSRARHNVHDMVPVEFQIDRARKMIADLTPDIEENMRTIAVEEVEVERLHKEIAVANRGIERERTAILTMRHDLNKGGDLIYAGVRYTSAEVKADLAHRFERFKTAEETLKARQQMLTARERTLIAARQKVEGMLATKRDLEVKVDNLEARLKVLQAAQATTPVTIDDSQLAKTRKLVDDLQKTLDVQERVLNQAGKFTSEIPVNGEPARNIDQQIDDYFGQDQSSGKTTTQASTGTNDTNL